MGNQDQVKQNFGPRAANYQNSSVHGNPADLERMIRLIRPSLEDSGLDVATGGGHTAIQLAPLVKQVTAIDITKEMLAQAEKSAQEKRLDNIEFRIEDVHNMNFADHSFDIVVSRFAVHHFAEVHKALREMCRVLKPGGKLYILDCSVVDGDESEYVYNKIEQLRDNSHVCSYSPREWKEMLSHLPLEVRQIDFFADQYVLPDWFDRMETPDHKRQEILAVLDGSSDLFRDQYPYNRDYITTYRIEILATKSL